MAIWSDVISRREEAAHDVDGQKKRTGFALNPTGIDCGRNQANNSLRGGAISIFGAREMESSRRTVVALAGIVTIKKKASAFFGAYALAERMGLAAMNLRVRRTHPALGHG